MTYSAVPYNPPSYNILLSAARGAGPSFRVRGQAQPDRPERELNIESL